MIRIGLLSPHAAIGPEEELSAMASGQVVTDLVRITAEAGLVNPGFSPPTTPAALRALTDEPAMDLAAKMLPDSIDVVGYASTTSAYAVGFEREAEIVSRLSALLGVPAVSTCASAVLGLRELAVQRLALVGAPWFDSELNELGAAYFRDQGFDVVSSGSAGLSKEPDRIVPAEVVAWTSHHARDEAEAIFIGGNGYRAAGAIEPLEAALGRPVLTSNQVLLWNLLARAGSHYSVNGFGQLFAHRPKSSREP